MFYFSKFFIIFVFFLASCATITDKVIKSRVPSNKYELEVLEKKISKALVMAGVDLRAQDSLREYWREGEGADYGSRFRHLHDEEKIFVADLQRSTGWGINECYSVIRYMTSNFEDRRSSMKMGPIIAFYIPFNELFMKKYRKGIVNLSDSEISFIQSLF